MRPRRIAILALVACGSIGATGELRTGGDVRVKYEHYVNRSWDPRQPSNAEVTHRELYWIDARHGRLRAYLEAEQSGERGAHAPLDPTWSDAFATPGAFVGYALGGTASKPAAAITVGRQLLAFGSRRMLDDRDGLNTLQAFDAIRVNVPGKRWSTDAFWARPVAVVKGAFDDSDIAGRSLFGVYATRHAASGQLDAYFLGDRRSTQFTWAQTAPEMRYTLGVHSSHTGARFDDDAEAAYQFGSFGSARIAAYFLEGDAGVRFPTRHATWRVSLGAGIASGNRGNGSTRTLFHAPYPTGYTLGILAANGPENVSGFAPGVSWTSAATTVTLKRYTYFRQSAQDGLYGTSGAPLRAPVGAQARVGDLGFLTVAHTWPSHLTASLAAATYSLGPFLRESGPAKGVASSATTYVSSSLEYRF